MSSQITTTKIAVKLAVTAIIMVASFFGTAGTFAWPEAWIYMSFQFSFSIGAGIWLKKNNPQLLKERMTFLKRSARTWDKVIVLTSALILLPYLFLPGLDAVRYRWSSVALPFKVAGFVGVLLSLALVFWVMRENSYLSRIIEIQQDHKVIASGPYAFIRHPMYVGVIILFFCIPIALGSLYTLILAVFFAILMFVRTHFEDRILRDELEGYPDYADQVKYRLIPGIR